MPMQKPLTTAEKAAIERRIARKKGPYSRVNPRAIGMAREAAMAFLEADINGDHKLDWDEFFAAIPRQVKKKHNKESIREIFDLCDLDKSGSITMDEYFLFTLSIAESVGSGIEGIFKRYDATGEGTLDSREFAHAVEDLGFGHFGHQLFLELDRDNSGSVSYSELMSMLKSKGLHFSTTSKRFLTALAFESPSHMGGDTDADGSWGSVLRTGKWKLTATSPEELRIELQTRLLEQSARVFDLYAFLVEKPDAPLTNFAWIVGMGKAGFAGDVRVLTDAFASIDVDGSNDVGVTELYDWMNCREEKRAKARDMKLRERGADAPDLTSIEEWTPDVLHDQLQAALMEQQLSPLDLITSWDTDESGELSKREFLGMFKRMVDDLSLWDRLLRNVVVETFHEVAGDDGSIDCVEFEKWMNHGWMQKAKGTSNACEGPSMLEAAAAASSEELMASTSQRHSTGGGHVEKTKRWETPKVAPVILRSAMPQNRLVAGAGRCSTSTSTASKPSQRRGLQRSVSSTSLKRISNAPSNASLHELLLLPEPRQPRVPRIERKEKTLGLPPDVRLQVRPPRPVVGYMAMWQATQAESAMAEAAAHRVRERIADRLALRRARSTGLLS